MDYLKKHFSGRHRNLQTILFPEPESMNVSSLSAFSNTFYELRTSVCFLPDPRGKQSINNNKLSRYQNQQQNVVFLTSRYMIFTLD